MGHGAWMFSFPVLSRVMAAAVSMDSENIEENQDFLLKLIFNLCLSFELPNLHQFCDTG